MKKLQLRYKKAFSILSLCAYLFISGYSLFHFHKTDYFLEPSVNIEGKIYIDSGFHHNGFCQLFQFNSSQLSWDIDLVSDCKPNKILINQFTITTSLISSEINSLLRRGPPSLS